MFTSIILLSFFIYLDKNMKAIKVLEECSKKCVTQSSQRSDNQISANSAFSA